MIRSWNPLLVAGFVVLAAVAQSPSMLAAQPVVAENAIRRISLDESIIQLEAQNLELRLAREESAAAAARVVTAGAVPNPGVSALREQLSGDAGGYHETTFALGQTLQIGGQRGLRRETARRVADAADSRLEATRLRLVFEVHAAYLRAAAAEADLAVLVEATEIFRRVEESGRSRFAEGDISHYDRSRLQIERARYETLLARARLTLGEASRELTLLVAPDSVGSSVIYLPAERLSDLTTAAGAPSLEVALLAASTRADVRAAEAEMAAAETARALQRRLRIPDVTLSGGYKHQADGYGGAVIGVSVPLPLWDRNRGGMAEAEANLNTARARRELVLRRAQSEIRRAWETHRSLEQRMRLLGETLMPESAGLLETARVAYVEDEMSLIELLDAADAYRGARESVNALLAEFLIAASDLERATGHLLGPQPAPVGASR